MVGDDKEKAERFNWILHNFPYEEGRNGSRTYHFRPELLYDGDVILSIDYLMGKLGTHPSVEQYLTDSNLFGRGDNAHQVGLLSAEEAESMFKNIGHNINKFRLLTYQND